MQKILNSEGGMEVKPEMEERLRQAFKRGNRFMLLMWRLGLGAYINILPEYIGQIMVLTHTGRKTSAKRQTPVNYAILDGEVYCTAGFGSIADWYRNILKDPKVELWLPDGWWQGVAEDASNSPRRNEIMRQVLIASGFAARAFGMDPKTIGDAELAAATTEYKLIRIHRTAACTGPGGPGELAWIWPLATFILLPLVLLKPKK
jgi:deazaflavin-dependent oxidoreductase (nitroreductase family)